MPDTDHFAENTNIESRLVFGKHLDAQINLSVVIPTYKRIDLLRKCLKAILEQEHSKINIKYEVVVVSNDPEFNCKGLALDLDPEVFRIYVNEDNLGMCGNMNRCAAAAHGDYIAYIQDDDVLLPNYFNVIFRLIDEKKLDSIDWLIPNRYYLMPQEEKQSQFGKKAMRNMKIKRAIGGVLRLGRPVPELQRITPYETLITTYPFYAGGPTCGMVFKRVTLLESGGFDSNYPYGFDYTFFIDFAKTHTVVLYNRYLSIYMTSDSASNKPEVQYDFFRARFHALEKMSEEYGISDGLKKIIHYVTYSGYPRETQGMVAKKFSLEPTSPIVCRAYLLWARLKTYRSGGYRRKACPAKFLRWYNEL